MERVLTVSARRFKSDVWGMPGYDDRHIKNTLIDSGLVENVYSFYFIEYPNPNIALIEYCRKIKPQAIMLSINSWPPTHSGPPTVNTLSIIKKELDIPIVMFWFDIHVPQYIPVMANYSSISNFNVIFGSDNHSHIQIPPEVDYIYAGLAFENKYLDLPDIVKDIDVGFLGTLWESRASYIDNVISKGFKIYTNGGLFTDGKIITATNRKTVTNWIPYIDYLNLTSRLKISLNFSYLNEGKYQVRGRVWETMLCKTLLLEEDNPVTCRYFTPYVDYVPFTDIDDLIDKVRYYLSHEDEYDTIRLHGWETVTKYYNAKIFWQSIFETVKFPLGGSGVLWNPSYLDTNLGESL